MREFQANGRTISGYLAVPEYGSGPGVIVLHAWWGLTETRLPTSRRLPGPSTPSRPDISTHQTARPDIHPTSLTWMPF